MTYISKGNHLYDMDSFSFVGTSHFNIVWENVCQDIFDNQLQKKLNMLDLPEPLHDAYAPEDNLMDVIEKPLWTMAGKRAKYTLTPDLISISNKVFFILDAKYYVASIEKGKALKGQPGIISITKQYLYQLAYRPLSSIKSSYDKKRKSKNFRICASFSTVLYYYFPVDLAILGISPTPVRTAFGR